VLGCAACLSGYLTRSERSSVSQPWRTTRWSRGRRVQRQLTSTITGGADDSTIVVSCSSLELATVQRIAGRSPTWTLAGGATKNAADRCTAARSCAV
jgi:hypothetical protein